MQTHAEFDSQQRAEAAGIVCLEAIKALLAHWGEKDLGQMNERVYRAYSCGPWLAVRLHNGTWVHGTRDLENVKLEDVGALKVGSIVEGSDAEIEGDVLELVSYEDDPDALRLDFGRQLEGVDDQVQTIWYEMHPDDGCDED